MKELVIAWIKKYIFHIKSPYARLFGYDYEWDFLKYATWDDLFRKGVNTDETNN